MQILFLKFVIRFLRFTTTHAGTALPGLILEKYFPQTLKSLLSQLDRVIVITGTNGKTTTSKMLGHLFKSNGIDFISNVSGSNLIRGVASTLIEASDISGHLKTKIAIFEIEEGSFPTLSKLTKPELVVVTNIFRDQLDAYGEIDKTLSYISQAISNSKNPKLVLNGDDERVRSLGALTSNCVSLVRLDPNHLAHIKLENRGSNDFQSYNSSSDSASSATEYKILNINISENLTSSFEIISENRNQSVTNKVFLSIPGLHNIVNATLAIIAFCEFENISLSDAINNKNVSLESLLPAFGRGEIIQLDKTNFQILLVKNPAGMNLNLELLEYKKDRDAILLILNDNTADGKDISWIWDCNFGLLKNLNFKNIYLCGTRVWDLALRLKYEGIDGASIFNSTAQAIETLRNKNHKKVFVLPTYTAMLELRHELSKKTSVKKMWKEI